MNAANLSPIDSVVFRTRNLEAVRHWYEQEFGLRVGTIERDGKTAPDADARYVNFRSGDVLIGFETGDEVDRARLVFMSDDLAALKRELASKGVRPSAEQGTWCIVKDPEGREVILQQRT